MDPYIIEGDLRLGSVIRCTAKGLDVRLSSDANNMLKLGNDGGLYGMLPHFADDSVQCNSGSCIDITVSGTGTDCNPIIVSGDLRIDPTCDLVHCGPNGLCVDPAKLEIANGSCVKLDLTGNGSNLHPYQLTASPIINPTGSGLLSCGPNGLNVAPTLFLQKTPIPLTIYSLAQVRHMILTSFLQELSLTQELAIYCMKARLGYMLNAMKLLDAFH